MLILIHPIGTEHLLFKVLVIDRATVHVVNSIWLDGLEVALKLWMCAVLHVTFFSRIQETNCLIINLPGFF